MVMEAFGRIFGKTKCVVIGMVHLRALPGSPRCNKNVQETRQIALEEAEILHKAGLDGIIIENMHDRPYLGADCIGPETVANMAVICRAVRQKYPTWPMGIQILSGANKQALAVAQATGLNFIRAEGFVFSHIGDEGPMHSCAAELLRYRKSLGADEVHIFTDIKKKHSSHAITSDVSLAETAQAAQLFLSDGLIVTGTATGQPTNPSHIAEVQNAVDLPVLVGSGVNEDNISQYASANGIIIGSSLKCQGLWSNDLDPVLVNRFMAKVKTLTP